MHWLRGPHWKQRKIKKLEWKYKSNNDGLLGQGIKRGSRDKQIVHDSKSLHSCLTLCKPMDCGLPGSSVHVIIQARILEWVAISFSRGPSWPRNQIQVSCIAGRFSNDWAMRETQIDNSYWLVHSHIALKNTGVGSLSLLLWIFLTQELNWGLLHCRQILYQLSY